MSRARSLGLLAIGVVGVAVLPVSQPVSAAPMTFEVTSAACSGPGSIEEAFNQANSNPGVDTIEFAPGLQVNASSCSPGNDFLLQATESVNIDGMGGAIVGKIDWVTSGGLVTPLDSCPTSSDLVVATTQGFLRADDNVNVEVRRLGLESLMAIAIVGNNASLLLEDVTAKRILSHLSSCNRPAIQIGSGSDLTLRRNDWQQVINWGISLAPPVLNTPAIFSGTDAGDLTIEDSSFDSMFSGDSGSGIAYWDGATGSAVKMVSTTADETGGLVVTGDAVTEIVNSAISMGETGTAGGAERIVNVSTGDMTIQASTIMFPDVVCRQVCQSLDYNGVVLSLGTGTIALQQTAIGVNFPDDGTSSLVLADSGAFLPAVSGGFTADTETWIQPVSGQTAFELGAITNQPALRTSAPGLKSVSLFLSFVGFVSPLQTMPSQVLGVIPNAACGSGNELINPIDGVCIATDVFGSPRTDGAGARDIGAVELDLTPHLIVTASGDGTVDLGWNRPQDPTTIPPGPVTGYEAQYRPAASAPAGAWTSVPLITDATTIVNTVDGLTNGTEYEFQVRPLYGANAPGLFSNTSNGTPLGVVGAPTPIAEPGDGMVRLFWSEPDAGGHPTPLSYSVVYRAVGATAWTAGPGFLSGRTTLISGLVNGTAYEFGVIATATDSVSSELGTTVMTPRALALATDPAVNSPGAPVTVTATGFCPEIPVDFFLDGTQIGSEVADNSGIATFQATAPDSAGSFELRAESPDCRRADGAATVSGQLIVESTPTTTTPPTTTPPTTVPATTAPPTVPSTTVPIGGELPETGSNTTRMLPFAMLLIALGGATIASTRKRPPFSSNS